MAWTIAIFVGARKVREGILYRIYYILYNWEIQVFVIRE
jgi:hypothetical protein